MVVVGPVTHQTVCVGDYAPRQGWVCLQEIDRCRFSMQIYTECKYDENVSLTYTSKHSRFCSMLTSFIYLLCWVCSLIPSFKSPIIIYASEAISPCFHDHFSFSLHFFITSKKKVNTECKNCIDGNEKLFVVHLWLRCFFIHLKYLGGLLIFFFLETSIKISWL